MFPLTSVPFVPELGLSAFEAGVAVASLAAVVAIYLAFASFYDRARQRRERDAEIETTERTAAVEELDALGNVLAAVRFEAAVLREVAAEAKPDRVFERLLARLVPDVSRDAAEVSVETDGNRTPLRVRGNDARVLETPAGNALRPVSEFVVETRSKPTYRLRTTAYGPLGGDESGRAVVRRLFETAVTTHVRLKAADRNAEDLWFAHERLSLRQVTDGHTDKPAEMLEAFIDDLARRVGADRASLFLSPTHGGGDFKLLARRGAAGSPGIDRTARGNDLALAKATQYGSGVVLLSGERLRSAGVVSLDGAALAVALRRGDRPLGVVVLTRVRPDGFGARDVRLAEWAADHLSESISRVANRAAMVRMARRDGLTDLANRREFDERLESLLAAGTPVSLLMCDVDRFKSVNDTYGHLGGDEVLRIVAAVIQREMLQTRSNDDAMAARYGGEEIALLLPGFGVPGAARVAEAIRAAVERAEIAFEGNTIRVTTSVGVSSAAGRGTAPAELVGAADEALYRAKQTGRNRVCVTGEGGSASESVPAKASLGR